MNIDDKRELYAGFVRYSIVSIVLLAILLVGMFLFLT
jgi:hypothetical protein